MTRLLLSLVVAALISTSLVSLIAVLVLPTGTSTDTPARPPARPIPLTPSTPGVAGTAGVIPASGETRPSMAMPPPVPAAPTAPPLTPQQVPAPVPASAVVPTAGPLPAPARPDGRFALPQAALPSVAPASLAPGGSASSPSPLFRVEPRYPARAQRANLEGYVRLGFTITPQGQVSDIQVLDAQPAGIFEQAAIRALRRWRYAPQPQPAGAPRHQTVNLVFELNGQQP